MTTALDNLLANAGRNNMLSQDGMFRNADYYRLWLESQKNINPNLGAAIDIGGKALDGGYSSGSDSFTSNVPSTPASEAQSYYDYWKDDGVSGRDLAQWGGLLTGAPISSITDFAMGKNPAGNIGSMIGSTVLGNQAGSLEEYIALSNVGGIAGQYAGEQLAPGQWMGYNPGRTTSEALGFEEGSKGFDTNRDLAMEVISEKISQGMTVDEAVAEFDKEAKEDQTYSGPVQVVEKSQGYGMQAPGESIATDYAGNIQEIVSEPTSVSDFAGMFSSTVDGVGDWFSNAYDSVTGSFTGMQANEVAPLTYAQGMSNAYGSESDPYGMGYKSFGSEGDATSRDESGAVFHGGSYNWGSTDGGASGVSSGTDFRSSDSLDADDEASANSDGSWD